MVFFKKPPFCLKIPDALRDATPELLHWKVDSAQSSGNNYWHEPRRIWRRFWGFKPKHKSYQYTDLFSFLRLTCQTTPYNLGEYLMAP